MDNTPQVLIVGAGPVGLTLACELCRHKIPFRIIDKKAKPVRTSNAVSIHARTMEVFETMGIIEKFIDAGVSMNALNIYANNELLAHIDINRVDSPYNFTLNVPQNITEGILHEHLEKLGHGVESETALISLIQEEGVNRVTLQRAEGEEETSTFRYVVGCDGSHSKVRHELKMRFEGLSYPENFVQADLILEGQGISYNEGYAFLTRKEILTILPIGKKYCRCIASVDEAIKAEDLSIEFFEQMILDRSPIALESLRSPNWFDGFKIHRRKVAKMSQGGVFLAGDSAHIHSPIAGQGMNGGIQDAYNLSWKLAYVLKGYCGESLLDTYSKERSIVAEHILKRTHLLTNVLRTENILLQELRNIVVPLLGQFDYVQDRFVNFIEQTKVNYRKSKISVDSSAWGRKEPMAGDRAPDTYIQAPQGITHTRLYDYLKGTEFKLLIFTNKKSIDQTNKILSLVETERYKKAITPIVVSKEVSSEINIPIEHLFRDPSRTSFIAYNVDVCAVFLIRPDNYIGFRCNKLKVKGLKKYLESLFPSP